MAPEIADWFDWVSLPKVAELVKHGIAVFGAPFPRDQSERLEFLDKFKGELRAEWDPFDRLTDEFYSRIDDDAFNAAAEIWIRSNCGIQNLHSKLEQ